MKKKIIKDWDAFGLLLWFFGLIISLFIFRSFIVVFVFAGLAILRTLTIMFQLAFFD